MNGVYKVFLQILKAALQGQQLTDLNDITQDDWSEIFRLSETHSVLPLVYQTVFAAPALKDATAIRGKVRRLVMLQTMKTNEFLQLHRKLQEAGCTPLVVKGLVCRSLYPQPDLRLSSDEDILIPAGQFDACCGVLEESGMYTDTPEEQFRAAYEVPYRKRDGVLYVELHKSLFPAESDAYGDWNRFFQDAFQNAIHDGEVLTLSHTDHLFYLLCHAFKHFIHSGFGIRQVCDIVMYANAYGKLVDWKKVYENCCQIHGEVFAAALFRIGENYLTFNPEQANYPQFWRDIPVDETDMLLDLLSGGVYGGASMSRKHSSNMTLDAVTADKQGKKAKKSLKNTLFPPAKSLENRYTYLVRKPYLLPVAWASRILCYARETNGAVDNSAMESLQIGSQRVELLRKYHVIQ